MGKKTIELLKSGNFTLLYHNNGHCTLHEGKIKYKQSNEEEKNYVEEIEEFTCQEIGYAPAEVVALVKALGGRLESL